LTHQAREGEASPARLLAPLAFVSPRIVAALLDGSAPADLTLTMLTHALSHSWAETGAAPRGRLYRSAK